MTLLLLVLRAERKVILDGLANTADGLVMAVHHGDQIAQMGHKHATLFRRQLAQMPDDDILIVNKRDAADLLLPTLCEFQRHAAAIARISAAADEAMPFERVNNWHQRRRFNHQRLAEFFDRRMPLLLLQLTQDTILQGRDLGTVALEALLDILPRLFGDYSRQNTHLEGAAVPFVIVHLHSLRHRHTRPHLMSTRIITLTSAASWFRRLTVRTGCRLLASAHSSLCSQERLPEGDR